MAGTPTEREVEIDRARTEGRVTRAQALAALADPDEDVRVAAAVALGEVGSVDDLEKLVPLTASALVDNRADALGALCAMIRRHGVPVEEVPDSVRRAIYDGLEDSSALVVESVASCIAHFGDTGSLMRRIRATSDGETYVREVCLRALGTIKTDEVRSFLEALTAVPMMGHRSQPTASTLGEIVTAVLETWPEGPEPGK